VIRTRTLDPDPERLKIFQKRSCARYGELKEVKRIFAKNFFNFYKNRFGIQQDVWILMNEFGSASLEKRLSVL
jgi:hypothetical protein